MSVHISVRKATRADDAAIWAILEPIIRQGETYTFPRDISRCAALDYWQSTAHYAYVAIIDDKIVGTYWIRANQPGGGAHVANAGFATHNAAQGQGVATFMCADALDKAKQLGFLAMQFNFVIATNKAAIKIWQRFGFETVGRLPGAFQRPNGEYIDALVMYRQL